MSSNFMTLLYQQSKPVSLNWNAFHSSRFIFLTFYLSFHIDLKYPCQYQILPNRTLDAYTLSSNGFFLQSFPYLLMILPLLSFSNWTLKTFIFLFLNCISYSIHSHAPLIIYSKEIPNLIVFHLFRGYYSNFFKLFFSCLDYWNSLLTVFLLRFFPLVSVNIQLNKNHSRELLTHKLRL